MDDDYIYDEELEEQQSSSTSKRSSNSNNTLDNGRKIIEKATDGSLKEDYGKVKEGIGKLKSGDKTGISDIMDGTSDFRDKGKIEETGNKIKRAGESAEKIGDAAKKAGSNIKNASRAGEKASEGVEKGAEAARKAAKGAEQAAKATKAAGAATKNAGAATKAAGEAASTAGDIANAAGLAADATGVGAVAGVPLNVAGTAASIGGKVATGVGAGTEAAGAATEAAGEAGQVAAKAGQAAATGVENAAKIGKKAGKLGKNFGDKLEKTGDKIKSTGEAVKDFGKKIEDVGKKTTSVIKTAMNPIKMFFIILLVSILCIIVFFTAVLSPLLGAMQYIKKVGDFAERVNNFSYGLGFGNSIDAFYDELDFLDSHYDASINKQMLMATLFYDDILNDKNVLDSETELLNTLESDSISSGIWGTVYSSIVAGYGEAVSETDDQGLVYTANKIFRLKDLTKNMMSKGGSTETASLTDYISNNLEIINNDRIRTVESGKSFAGLYGTWLEVLLRMGIYSGLISLEASYPMLSVPIDTILAKPFFQFAAIDSAYLANKLGNNYEAIQNFFRNVNILVSDLITTFTDICGIEFSLIINTSDSSSIVINFTLNEDGFEASLSDSDIDLFNAFDFSNFSIDYECEIEYDVYTYDEEKYESYLKEEYIPKMPEFKEYIVDENGEINSDKVDEVYENIVILSKVWEEIAEEPDGTAEGNNLCIGDINTEILDKLSPPVQIETGTPITFTTKTAFGTTSFGKMHNGVDINEESAGVGVGTAVSSVYDGTVVASTASNDFSDDEKSGDGGWVKIEHTISYTGDEGESVDAHVYTIYGGLDPTSVPTTGTAVSAGQQIGVIGDVIYSEDGVTPGLHFGFYDIAKIKFLNPLNVFIYCSKIGQNNGYGDITINSSSCLKVHQISISLENFKKSVNAYIQRNSNTSAASYLNTWDLDEVYNEAVRNNINPELLVVRAIKEGFSPYNKDRSNYNYWGLGCYNGSGRCEHYSSMASGIAGFASARSVRSAESLEDMMSTYAYIGNNWYTRTQGSSNYWSDGGCPYFPYIRKYMPSGRAEEVARYCENPFYVCVNDSTPTCFPTIAVDQTAYTMYNIQGMNDDYVEIFGAYHEGRDGNCSNQVSGVPDNENIITPGAFPNGSQLLDEPLSDFLIRQGSSIDKMNFEITKAKNQVGGNCTRNGSIAVATKTLNIMASYDTRLQYFWGGGHSGTSDEMKGVKANWGSNECSIRANGNHYNHCGLDCSGFVRWVLNTAGYNVRSFCVGHDSNCSDLYNDQARVDSLFPGAELVSTLSSANKLKPGDVMFSGHHVIYVVGVDSNGYTAAEASGFSSGILYKHYSFTPNGYHGIRMYGFYTNPANCAN